MFTKSSVASNGLLPSLSTAPPVGSRVGWLRVAGLLSFVALSSLSMGGCASMGHRNKLQSEVGGDNSSAYVNNQMGAVVNSVDQKLSTLVRLDRGDEGPRKTTPLGDTVAGAAGPNKAPYGISTAAGPDTEVGIAQHQERLRANRAILDTRVKLDWDGEASGFLSAMASKVGYGFTMDGEGQDPHISIHVKDATIQSVLTSVASQINKTADIHVDIEHRCISLVYR